LGNKYDAIGVLTCKETVLSNFTVELTTAMTKAKYSLFACSLVAALLLSAKFVHVFAQEQPKQALSLPASIIQPAVQEQSNDQAVEPDATPGTAVASNLTLSRTTIATSANSIAFGSSAAIEGFQPVTVVCPSNHTAGCTISVEVTGDFFDLTKGDSAGTVVDISGAGTITPATGIPVDSASDSPLRGESHSFTWLKTGIPAGSTQTVDIGFATTAGTAAVQFRTATIQLYLN
jgi:hypothetical protein